MIKTQINYPISRNPWERNFLYSVHRQICGDITVAHTAREISEFSVTSFYEVGLELGLIEKHDIVSYIAEDELDFEKIDKR